MLVCIGFIYFLNHRGEITIPFQRNLIIVLFIISVICNCGSDNKILIQVKDKQIIIEADNKKEIIDLSAGANNIIKHYNLLQSHDIPGCLFYTFSPYPIELAKPWDSDSIFFIVIYFDNKNISKYSKKYDDIKIITEYSNVDIIFDNQMKIEDIIKILNNNKIVYELIDNNFLKTKNDKPIKVFYNSNSKNIINISIFIEKEKKFEEPKIVP